MKNKNLFNRKSLKFFRSALRNKFTSAEAELWNILKSKNLDGRKFKRQYSIGSYIVDFCCPSENLIIELDGDPHGEYHKIQEDENRDKYIESLGFNQPPWPLLSFAIHLLSLYCGHPSFKRRGKLYELTEFRH